MLFPEECITGSMNKSDISAEEAGAIAAEASERSVPFVESLCRELRITVVVGTIEQGGRKFLNSALIVGPEGYLTTFRKLHLPNKTEQSWFEPGDALPIVTSQQWRFSVGICYDVQIPEIFRAAARNEIDFFLLAVGSSYAARDRERAASLHLKHKDHFMRVLPARAVDNGIYVIFANQAGVSGKAWFPGLCVALDPFGHLVAEHMQDEGMILVDVSREVLAKARESIDCTVWRTRPETYARPRIVEELIHRSATLE